MVLAEASTLPGGGVHFDSGGCWLEERTAQGQQEFSGNVTVFWQFALPPSMH